MDLLPRNCSDFSSESYWQTFFKRRSTAFEWYGDYRQLRPLLQKHVRPTDHVLHVGCGNSTLGHELYTDLSKTVLNIDLSDVAIRQMQQKYANDIGKNDGLRFERMDALHLSLPDDTIDVTLDKGTLDALLGDSAASSDRDASAVQFLNECVRVLKMFGRFVCISLLQEHVLKVITRWVGEICSHNCIVRVQKVNLDLIGTDKLISAESSAIKFPVFMVIVTKLKERKSSDRCLFELCLADEYGTTPERTFDQVKVHESIKQLQNYALIRHHLTNNRLPSDEEIVLELFDAAESTEFKYRLHVLEQVSRDNQHKVVVFLVPVGREREYLFSTREGRLQLAKLCSAQRLIVTHLNGNYDQYPPIDQLKAELSEKVMQLCPDASKEAKYPIMSVEERPKAIMYRGQSEFSGKFVVAEVPFDPESNGDSNQNQNPPSSKYVLRQLIFDSNRNVIQSEARVRMVKQKNKLKKYVDHSWLACGHHSAFFFGFGLHRFVQSINTNILPSKLRVLLIGLGGGCFASFVQHNLLAKQSTVELDVIEIDPEMLKVAQEWFSLDRNTSGDSAVRLNCIVTDGLEFVKQKVAENAQYDVIIFDVDNKESASGLSCPPAAFVQPQFIEQVHSLVSPVDGLFMLNLAARSQRIKQQVLEVMCNSFACVAKYDIPDETNTVAYCFRTESVAINHFWTSNKFEQRCEKLEKTLDEILRNPQLKHDLFNLTKLIEKIDILK